MTRRSFITAFLSLMATALFLRKGLSEALGEDQNIEKIYKSKAEWRKILTPEQFHILREEGTEPPYSSALLDNKDKGLYVCVGCDLPLFRSKTKYDSRTGWPSFYTFIHGALETKVDRQLIFSRTEYHCARCGGHQGHIFKDGPAPTYKRWCNNGVALKFIPSS